MVEDFGREKLMKRKRAMTNLYIVIVEAGKAYRPASGKSGRFPSMILLRIGVVSTTVFSLFLFAQ